MPATVRASCRLTEAGFAAMVDAVTADDAGRASVVAWLDEAHEHYDQRGTDVVDRMRGWLLLALPRVGLSDAALACVLEELQTGTSPYLVAAAARVLRVAATPSPAFAPLVVGAIARLRYHDMPVSLEAYGDELLPVAPTGAVRELLQALAWLGPHASAVRTDVEALRAPGAGLPPKHRVLTDAALAAIGEPAPPPADDCCAMSGTVRAAWTWASPFRRDCTPLASIAVEDHAGRHTTVGELLNGRPAVVAFFYTRCDNPLKCSLTIAKLSRLQRDVEAAGLQDAIRIVAFTYDPAFDRAERLRAYGEARGLRLDGSLRLVRAVNGFEPVRRAIGAGVGFVGSLVNRHRLEVHVIDRRMRLAASFVRLEWSETEVLARAVEALAEHPTTVPPRRAGVGSPIAATVASLAIAFFPKCPLCWASYLSAAGIAGLERVPYVPWLQPVLAAGVVANVSAIWMRERRVARPWGALLASAGAVLIAGSTLAGWEGAGAWGVALTAAGSLAGTVRGAIGAGSG